MTTLDDLMMEDYEAKIKAYREEEKLKRGVWNSLSTEQQKSYLDESIRIQEEKAAQLEQYEKDHQDDQCDEDE